MAFLVLAVGRVVAKPIADTPFWQDVAVRIRHADSLSNAVYRRVRVDQENVVHVLTDRGMARVYDDTLVPDRSWRPLADTVPKDIAVSDGDLFLLYADRVLSNARNGTFARQAPAGAEWLEPLPDGTVAARTGSRPAREGPRGRAPVDGVTARVEVSGGVWFGSPRGAYFERDGTSARYATPSAPGIEPPVFRYYAGKRWLRDDAVVDLTVDRDGHVWVLTATGLNKIEFRSMTLAEKARWFSRKIRSRNIRFGLTAEALFTCMSLSQSHGSRSRFRGFSS
jgi:hypothetical protein